MEPRIPDGSLNLFRLRPVGSRKNRILLIERFEYELDVICRMGFASYFLIVRDFIAFARSLNPLADHHDLLVIAQHVVGALRHRRFAQLR